MALKQLSSWDTYLHVLQTDPNEVATLYRDLLIDVTQFFRDPEVWEYLEREAIPALIAEHEEGVPLKIWVAGCATGEEAYSYAIVFREQLERLDRSIKVQIFATDVAEDALATARRGRYPASIHNDVSPERLKRCFRFEDEQYEVSRDVRELVTFATHNLLADPPFSGLSLVSCRNVLIYLESHAQHRVLQVFHFSLKPQGLLILGASETVGRYADLFDTLSTTARAYRPTRIAKALRHSEPHWGTTLEKGFLVPTRSAGAVAPRGPKVSRMIEQIVLSRFTWACVAVTESFEIRSFFGPTHEYLVQPTGEARMDPELLPHIFELFVQDTRTLDRAAGGLGLGLPLVKRVVEMHGGRVEASSPGRGLGSEFVVTLSRASEHRVEAQHQPLEAGGADGPPRRILVVDDELDAASTLTELLELHGHEARGVGDGDAAFDAVRSFRPDVVLLDIGLPKMDGYEVARRLREEHGPQLRLVALTGYQKDAERLERSGFDHHVIKPPDLPVLLEWLRQGGDEGERPAEG